MYKFKKIFFAVFPFVLYGVFRGFMSPFLAGYNEMIFSISLVALILLSALIVLQIVFKDKMYFPSAVLLVFCFYLIMSVFVRHSIISKVMLSSFFFNKIISKPEIILYSSLFVIAFLPPFFKLKPFTAYFAENMVQPQFVLTRLYKTVNLFLNYYWALLFLISALSQFLNSMTLNITIPVLCMGLLGGGGMKFLIPFLSRKLAFVEKGQPKEYLKTARDAIFGMPFIFNPKAAKSWEFVLQFDISGDENFNAYLEIEKGKCTCKEGIHKSANMTIKSPAKVWLDIAKGNISGEVGFLRRMFTVEGDMSYLFKMNKIFGMAKEKYEKKYQSIENSSSMEKTFYKAKPGEIKSILAIQASPRIQNVSKTEVMLQTFLKGCKDGGAVTETVYLKDKTVNFCTGCYTCWTKTPGKCIFDDDVEEIFKKAQKADLVIYASPLYHFGIYSKLKAYIERTLIEFEPYLVENNGKTGHPLRKQYQKENNYTIIMGVCGFPELNHFELFSAHFHFLSASRYADAPKIIAEIYRPASETLGIGFYKEENKRVLAAVQKAGEEVVKSGYIKDELIKEISAIGFDADGMRNESNMFWDLCINEKKLPSQMQQEM